MAQVLITVVLVYTFTAQLGASQGCIEGDLQLQSPVMISTNNITFLQYCFNNTWRRVCQLRWGEESARVACRQLGYSDQMPKYGLHCDDRNQASVRLNRSCEGTEKRLQECELEDIQCVICDYVWLECEADCTNGKVRLVNGSNWNEGRVEVCTNGHWGTICNKSQEGIIAKVACSRLGFPEGMIAQSSFPQGIVPISNCTVQERNNLSCTQISDASCDHSMDLGVKCITYKQLYDELIAAHHTTQPTNTIPSDAINIITALGVTAGVLLLLLIGTAIALVTMCRIRIIGTSRTKPAADKTSDNQRHQPITNLMHNLSYDYVKYSK